MEQWQKSLADSIDSPAQLAGRFNLDIEQLRPVAARYPMRITPHYLSLIEEAGDPIWQQCIPDPQELNDTQQADPLNEQGLSPVPGLIHRYPDRVVWLVSSQCAVYCRFCMRKRGVGCGCLHTAPADHDAVLAYIAENPQIHDVVLSGGEPLLLNDEVLDGILARLRKIHHVDIVRIGTRVPVTLPERITRRLCRILRQYHPLYINTHFNHPREITPASSRACARLADIGIPLANQTVLLKGVNDHPDVMKLLMQRLLKIRVRPYYIHQMDLVQGTGHFRTPVTQGIAIMEGLRGHISGMANPYYVVDLPGGKGKVPILPDYVKRQGGVIFLRNYRGEIIEYQEIE